MRSILCEAQKKPKKRKRKTENSLRNIFPSICHSLFGILHQSESKLIEIVSFCTRLVYICVIVFTVMRSLIFADTIAHWNKRQLRRRHNIHIHTHSRCERTKSRRICRKRCKKNNKYCTQRLAKCRMRHIKLFSQTTDKFMSTRKHAHIQ